LVEEKRYAEGAKSAKGAEMRGTGKERRRKIRGCEECKRIRSPHPSHLPSDPPKGRGKEIETQQKTPLRPLRGHPPPQARGRSKIMAREASST